MTERLDVGFVPAECPGANATGATHTSTLLIRHLSRHHDLTVYVASQMDASERDLPAEDRVEYVLHDDLPNLPHPITTKVNALREETDSLNEHDLVHAYSSAFIPVLADLDVPALSTLNSYVPVCPKGDMRYKNEEKCGGPSAAKCTGCVAATALSSRRGVETELRAGYDALGRLGFVRDSIERSGDIDAFHALSPHIREDYGDLGFPRERTTVVPHFYDDAFVAEPTEPGDSLELLYVGGIQHIKGVDLLVRALPELESRGVDVTLRIAGTGAYTDACKSLAATLDVEDRIEWLGYVDHADLPDEYERADAFVYPGRIDEPFGRVLLEALASRTPVIAADVGSTDYIVGEAGVRFEPEDPGALADAVADVRAGYDAHVAAIPDQLVEFEPEAVIGRFLDLYAETAGLSHPQTVR